jgi:hypothetical protein
MVSSDALSLKIIYAPIIVREGSIIAARRQSAIPSGS